MVVSTIIVSSVDHQFYKSLSNLGNPLRNERRRRPGVDLSRCLLVLLMMSRRRQKDHRVGAKVTSDSRY